MKKTSQMDAVRIFISETMLFCHLLTKKQTSLSSWFYCILHVLKQTNVHPEGDNTSRQTHSISLLLWVHHIFCFTQTKIKKLSRQCCVRFGTSSMRIQREVKKKNRTLSAQQLASCAFGFPYNRKCSCSTCEHKVQHKMRQQGVLHKNEREKK